MAFDNKKLKEIIGLKPRKLQPYNFERYKKYNPNLTKLVYEQLRASCSEWKILCGLSISTHWGSEILKEVWYLKNNDGYKETAFYKYRFAPEHYLELTTW